MIAGEKVARRQARKERKEARKITSEVPAMELPDGMTPAQMAAAISGREEAREAEPPRPAAGPPAAGEEAAAGSGGGGGGAVEEERREIAEMLAEENVVEMTEEDREKLTELDSLTGAPPSLAHSVPAAAPMVRPLLCLPACCKALMSCDVAAQACRGRRICCCFAFPCARPTRRSMATSTASS